MDDGAIDMYGQNKKKKKRNFGQNLIQKLNSECIYMESYKIFRFRFLKSRRKSLKSKDRWKVLRLYMKITIHKKKK